MADDLYDFSGVSFDLELLRSELKSLQATTNRHVGYFDRRIKEEEEEWYPPTPPVYDVAEKLVEVNRIFQEDPTSTFYEPHRLRWRTGPALCQIKWIYNGEVEPEEHKNGVNEENSSEKENKEISSDKNPIPVEKLESTDTSNEKRSDLKKTTLPQLMLPKGTNKEEIKTVLPIKSKSISSTAIKETSNVPNRSNRVSMSDSPSTTTTTTVASSPPPKLSVHRPIERHQSSDSILSPASSLPPVRSRRHSSQDRMGRFTVKSSNSKLSGTSHAIVPIPLPPRPKDPKSSTTEKPKLKYSRSISGSILTPPRRDSEQIVIEQISLVNGDDRSKSNKFKSEIRSTEDGTPTKVKSTTKVILNRSRPLHRTVSYNSASSNSSVSSQATEETSLTSSSSSTESSIGKRLHRTPVLITHPRITAELPRRLNSNNSNNNNNNVNEGSSDGIVSQWKERKREEKRLAERRAFLESQMRRLS